MLAQVLRVVPPAVLVEARQQVVARLDNRTRHEIRQVRIPLPDIFLQELRELRRELAGRRAASYLNEMQ